MLYIDAEKMQSLLEEEIEECGNPTAEDNPIAYGTTLGLKMALSYAKTLPTADVAPIIHAHWIDKEENIYGLSPNILRVCSNCDTEYESTFMAACCAFIPSDAFGAGDDTKFPKCPCCGAKMDEEVKDDAGSE